MFEVQASNETPVMAGRIADFSLTDILQVVGLSRQCTSIKLSHGDGRWFGSVWLKAGRVIEASCQGARGRTGFCNLFGGGAELFAVARIPEPASYPQPLGTIDELLMDAQDIDAATPQLAPPVVAPVATPRPAAHAPAPPPLGIAIAIAAAKGGVGKTTMALNLALAFALIGKRTILIDGDLSGDVLSTLGARDLVSRGVYGLGETPHALDAVLRETAVPTPQILPSIGAEERTRGRPRCPSAAAWRAIIETARGRADVVVIDCPAGLYDVTIDIISAATHVINVVQADTLAIRSSDRIERLLADLSAGERPDLLGVLVNMFQASSPTSMDAFHTLAIGHARLFETSIPRHPIFSEANRAGMPVRFTSCAGASGAISPVVWLFEALAVEVCARAGLTMAPSDPVMRFVH